MYTFMGKPIESQPSHRPNSQHGRNTKPALFAEEPRLMVANANMKRPVPRETPETPRHTKTLVVCLVTCFHHHPPPSPCPVHEWVVHENSHVAIVLVCKGRKLEFRGSSLCLPLSSSSISIIDDWKTLWFEGSAHCNFRFLTFDTQILLTGDNFFFFFLVSL